MPKFESGWIHNPTIRLLLKCPLSDTSASHVCFIEPMKKLYLIFIISYKLNRF